VGLDRRERDRLLMAKRRSPDPRAGAYAPRAGRARLRRGRVPAQPSPGARGRPCAALEGGPLGTYDELSLEALVLRDERAARDFLERELGPLLDHEKRTDVLLGTLRVYADSNWNAASASARLGVHERAVGYRLATIEERLGHPLAARRDEIGVALRLQAALAL
jgi:hypothetical protein